MFQVMIVAKISTGSHLAVTSQLAQCDTREQADALCDGVEKQNKELVLLNVDLLKQKLSGMLIGNFYSIVFLQEAIKIKDEELLSDELEVASKKKYYTNGRRLQSESRYHKD